MTLQQDGPRAGPVPGADRGEAQTHGARHEDAGQVSCYDGHVTVTSDDTVTV